jgi:hypothetical protein
MLLQQERAGVEIAVEPQRVRQASATVAAASGTAKPTR